MKTTKVRLAWLALAVPAILHAQQGASNSSTVAQVQELQQNIQRVENQLQQSERELLLLKQQLEQLRAVSGVPSPEITDPKPETPANSALAEQQAMEASQIATLDQSKVESDSKYPVRINGMILLNGFANSAGTDVAAVPTSAIGGRGDTGMSLRQTMLGIDARGPRLLGAQSHADIRVDFFGTSTDSAYNNAGGLLRLRTAHASLQWKHTEAFFEMDRPLLNPHTPTSLTAVAVPELAWAGNLWSWVPQFGVTHTMGERRRLRVQAALIDPGDPPYATIPNGTSVQGFNLAEHSRTPGVESRIAFLGADDENGLQIGVGGYFSRHTTVGRRNFDASATTLDWRVPLWRNAGITGNAYYGRALGGLGAGGYKDYVYRSDTSGVVITAPRDAGGWIQLKQTFNQRFDWNTGFGIDNVYAADLRPNTLSPSVYGNIARNRAVYSNLIYTPRAYLLFSAEYRYLTTWPVAGSAWNANIFGLAAGYRF